MLTLTLTPDNMDFFERLPFDQTIRYLGQLDDSYYSVIPSLQELAAVYGDPGNEQYFSARDLYMKYQTRFIAEHHLKLYDINDERQCFSRRF